jgi:hypothetical protein
MKEYDLDSYSRKWRGTSGLFKDHDGVLRQAYYAEFFAIARGSVGCTATVKEGPERWIVNGTLEGYQSLNILYAPIQSGWYAMNGGGWGLLTRKHTRAFQVGVCVSSHLCLSWDADDVSFQYVSPTLCKFLEPAQEKPFDPAQPWGILDFRLWWNKTRLMYLNQTIGMFCNGKWLLEDDNYLPYVKPLLGDACQTTY